MSFELGTDQQVKVSDVIQPVMLVEVAAPSVGVAGGPTARTSIDSQGRITEANSADIEVLINALVLAQEGFYGEITDKSPGEIVVTETQFTTDGAGAATVDVVPAPAAGKRERLLSIKLDGTNLAGGTFSVATGGSTLTLLTNNIAKGKDASRVNCLSLSATAMVGTMAAGGNAVTYTVLATHRVENE